MTLAENDNLQSAWVAKEILSVSLAKEDEDERR